MSTHKDWSFEIFTYFWVIWLQLLTKSKFYTKYSQYINLYSWTPFYFTILNLILTSIIKWVGLWGQAILAVNWLGNSDLHWQEIVIPSLSWGYCQIEFSRQIINLLQKRLKNIYYRVQFPKTKYYSHCQNTCQVIPHNYELFPG